MSERRRDFKELIDRVLSEPLPQGMRAEDIRACFGLSIPPADVERMTFREIMVRQLVLKACAGDSKSITEVLDRLVGKPVQMAEIKATQHTYHEFLLSCVEQDQNEKLGVKTAEVLPAPATSTQDDLLNDLL